ncbi:MAG: PD-(D/E)XK nuclease family protein [Actinobacteria bacterium]|nr:PD-(D/E)XK nuclease family protein [Actinomycetota bacterium]
MGLEVTAVAYGRPALEAMVAAVRSAKDADPLAPVTVVVPTNYAAVAARRSLAALGTGVAAVSFLTLHRLAERLGGPALAAAGRRPVSPPVVAEAVRWVLVDEPGMFASVADHPATEQALMAAHRELSAVSSANLEAVAGASRRSAEVVRVHRAVRAILAPAWHDEHDLLEAAATALLRAPGNRHPVVVHLPQHLTAAGATLLRALAAATTVRVLVGLTGEGPADESLHRAFARAGIHLPTGAGRPPATAQRILSVSDPDEEVRNVVRRLVDAARAGVAFGRMAVVYGSADPYLRLLHEHLAAVGIPYNGAAVRTIGRGLVGRTLRATLALPDRRFRRDDVLALVSSSRLLDGGGRWAPGRAWERVSRAAGVVGGDDWRERLAVFAEAQRQRAEQAVADDQPSLAARYRREADHADALSAFVDRLRLDLRAGQAAPGWAAKAHWAGAMLERYLGGPDRRRSWPDDERRAGERVEAALAGLAGLDALDGPPPTLEVFRRTLERELESVLSRTGRFGEGVLVGHVSIATGVCVDRLFVLGLAEGAFPGRRLEDSLLPDRERALAGGELPLRSERLHGDRHRLLAALAGAQQATLCFPRGDLRRPGDRTASRWLLADAAGLAQRERLRTSDLAELGSAPWFDQVPSFAAGVAACALPASAQDHALAVLARPRSGPLAEHAHVVSDPVLAAGVRLSQARRSPWFTRFDGNLAGLGLPRLTDGATVVSPTRLQAWARCPRSFLFEHLLHVDVADDPERVLAITALDRGSLVHTVLDRFLSDAMATGVPDGPWSEAHRCQMRAIGEQVCDDYERRGLTGRPLFWRRDRTRILADLERFLTEDERFRRECRARPVASELTFGLGSASLPAVRFPLPDGRDVRFRGAADRVDATDDGALMVTDYKTGGTRDYRGLTGDDPHRGGTLLQLAVYGAAARMAFGDRDTPVLAHYWFTSAKGGFERIGYAIGDDVLDAVGAAIAAIVDGVAVGAFPARPPSEPPWGYVECHYCDPDGLGAGELRRSWERKRRDPALAGYVALCEPEVLDAGA